MIKLTSEFGREIYVSRDHVALIMPSSRLGCAADVVLQLGTIYPVKEPPAFIVNLLEAAGK